MRTATTSIDVETTDSEWTEPLEDGPAQTADGAVAGPEEAGDLEVEAAPTQAKTPAKGAASDPLVGDLDVLGRFYADLAKTPLLDREEERTLTTEISKARDSVVFRYPKAGEMVERKMDEQKYAYIWNKPKWQQELARQQEA